MTGFVLALSGGVGGVKLSQGFASLFDRGDRKLNVVVNTGDDFDFYGLRISPDVDTAIYTLSGVVNLSTGWGRDNDSLNFLSEMDRLDGDQWFTVGDKDLAVHVYRTWMLQRGFGLTEITENLCRRFNLSVGVYPMTDSYVQTTLNTNCGILSFQEYFVKHKCAPVVESIDYQGSSNAKLSEEVGLMLDSPDLEYVVIFPSNPYLSIDPILSVIGLRDKLVELSKVKPVIAVSPIVAGRSIKGPASKLMIEFGLEVSPVAVYEHYSDFLNGYVIDDSDFIYASSIPVPTLMTNIIMNDERDRYNLASEVCAFAEKIIRKSKS